MTITEERLRDALAATAGLVTFAEAPVAPAGRPTRRRLSILPAPALAGLSVAAVCLVVAVVVAVVATAGSGRSSVGPATGTAGPSSPFFLANVAGSGSPDNAITVRSARTGAVVGRVPAPGGVPWDAIAATADPRVFFLAGEDAEHSLYRLTLDGRGTPGKPTVVGHLPTARDVRYIAANPAGTEVAYPVDSDSRPDPYGPARIDVVSVATGHHQVFQSSTTGLISSLSWDGSGRHVAFQLEGSKRDGLWVLDSHAGGDLLAASRRVAVPASVGQLVDPVLTADGGGVYVIAAQQNANGDKVTRVVEVDAGTGAQRRVLFSLPFTGRGGNALWEFGLLARDPSGGGLLVADDIGHAYRIDPATGHSDRLPFIGGDPNALAW